MMMRFCMELAFIYAALFCPDMISMLAHGSFGLLTLIVCICFTCHCHTHEKICRESWGGGIRNLPFTPPNPPSSIHFFRQPKQSPWRTRTHKNRDIHLCPFFFFFFFFPCNTNITPRLALIMRSNLLVLLCMTLAMMAYGLPTPGDDDNQAVKDSEQHLKDFNGPRVRIGMYNENKHEWQQHVANTTMNATGTVFPGKGGESQHIQLAE